MRRRRIAALMAGVDREYQQAFTWGMVHACREANVDLCVFNCQGQADGFVRNDRGESAIFDLFDPAAFDGVVFLAATIPSRECRDRLVKLLEKYPALPLVTIDCQLLQSVEITFDDLSSVRALMTHLLDEHGLKRFALVTGPMETQVARERAGVVMDLLADRNVELPPERIFDGRWVREGGRQAAEELLKQPRLPEIIVCSNDYMAFGVIERLGEAGFSVPADVRVTGFDALNEAVGRGVTTIRRPVRDAGALAVQTLLDWMNKGRPEAQRMLLPTQHVPGETCGCAPNSQRSSAYVRLLSEERRTAEASLLQASAFFGRLAGVSGMQEAGEMINSFAESLNVRQMHVCINPDFLEGAPKGQDGHFDTLLQLSGVSRGVKQPQQTFSARDLLPLMEQEPEGDSLALVFSPLYYTDRQLGYAVLDVEHAAGYALYSLLMLLSGALMSLSLNNTVRSYAQRLEDMSIHDPLTGLYNRRGFNRVAPVLFEQAKDAGRCFAVISCDMDGMKTINDSYGHLNGDQAICRMGDALRALEDNGLLCIHISGDEFLAIGEVDSPDQAVTLMEKLRQSITDQNENQPWICGIAASMGVYAAVPTGESCVDDFLMRADRRMYEEKKRHRARSSERL